MQFKKQTEDWNCYITEDDIQIINKHIESYSKSIGMKTKTKLRCHYTFIKKAKTNKQRIPDNLECWYNGHSHPLWVEM